MLITLFGESGAGKTTIENKLYELEFSGRLISCTSRKKRASDSEDAYYFLSVEDFEVDNSSFLEIESFGGNLYGLKKSELDRVLSLHSRASLVSTLRGFEQIFPKINGTIPSVLIYVTCDKELVRQRMLDRGDPVASVDYRIEQDSLRFENKIHRAQKQSHIDHVEDIWIDEKFNGYKIDTSFLSMWGAVTAVRNIVRHVELQNGLEKEGK